MIERDEELRGRYDRDVSGLIAVPDGVARPRDVDALKALVVACAQEREALLPVGAQTSTTGASVALGGGVIIDLQHLATPPELDEGRCQVTVNPATNLAHLQRWLWDRGWELPVDPTSAPDCTVGGALATNASGPSTFRYGAMADWTAAVVVIDSRGALRRFAAPRVQKQAMGPAALRDPTGLIVGSEGLFGVIVEATLRIQRRVEDGATVVVGFASRASLFEAVSRLRDRAADLPIRSIEWLDGRCHALLRTQGNPLKLPLTEGGSLTIELEGADGREAIDAAHEAICAAQPDKALADRAIALVDEAGREVFRAARHAVPTSLNEQGRRRQQEAGGGKLSTDWSVPVDRLGAIFQWTDQHFAALPIEAIYAYGHIGNGHPHLNMICADRVSKNAVFSALSRQLHQVVELGGTPFSEHGVGKLKRDLVRPYLPATTIAAIRAIKAELDPAGIFARGNVIERM